MGFHKDLDGEDLHIARSDVGLGPPIGVVTPSIVGQLYYDLAGKQMYIAVDQGTLGFLTDQDWEILGAGGFTFTLRYTHSSGVPGGAGIRFLRTGQGVVCSSAGDRLGLATRIVGISVEVDDPDGTRPYDIEILRDPSGSGTFPPTPLATLSLPVGTIGVSTFALSVSVPVNTEFGARLVRTAGMGTSTFSDINVSVYLEV